jgi:hypothetical protein
MLHRLVCILATTAVSCASIQDRYLATPIDERGQPSGQHRTRAGLVISGQELTAYSSLHFGMVQITLENRSSDWLHISRLALDFGGPEENAGVALPAGSDIHAWYNATIERNDIRETNAASVLAGLMLVGEVTAVVGAASGQREVAAAGAATALGALVVGTADAWGQQVANAEQVRSLPGAHLLALPVAVPPGLFAKRWVLLNTRDSRTPCVQAILLDYDVRVGGTQLEGIQSGHVQLAGAGTASPQRAAQMSRERVLLRFREPSNGSEWQRQACYVARPGGWVDGYH